MISNLLFLIEVKNLHGGRKYCDNREKQTTCVIYLNLISYYVTFWSRLVCGVSIYFVVFFRNFIIKTAKYMENPQNSGEIEF